MTYREQIKQVYEKLVSMQDGDKYMWLSIPLSDLERSGGLLSCGSIMQRLVSEGNVKCMEEPDDKTIRKYLPVKRP